jgi:hypothetical protein
MVTPFVRTPSRYEVVDHSTPPKDETDGHLSLDKAAMNDTTGSDATQQLGPSYRWEPTPATNLCQRK